MPKETFESPQLTQPTEPTVGPKTTNWPKMILAAVLGFGLLVGSAYAGYWYGTQQAQTEVRDGVGIDRPGWLNYHSKNIPVSFLFSSDFTVFDTEELIRVTKKLEPGKMRYPYENNTGIEINFSNLSSGFSSLYMGYREDLSKLLGLQVGESLKYDDTGDNLVTGLIRLEDKQLSGQVLKQFTVSLSSKWQDKMKPNHALPVLIMVYESSNLPKPLVMRLYSEQVPGLLDGDEVDEETKTLYEILQSVEFDKSNFVQDDIVYIRDTITLLSFNYPLSLDESSQEFPAFGFNKPFVHYEQQGDYAYPLSGFPGGSDAFFRMQDGETIRFDFLEEDGKVVYERFFTKKYERTIDGVKVFVIKEVSNNYEGDAVSHIAVWLDQERNVVRTIKLRTRSENGYLEQQSAFDDLVSSIRFSPDVYVD